MNEALRDRLLELRAAEDAAYAQINGYLSGFPIDAVNEVTEKALREMLSEHAAVVQALFREQIAAVGDLLALPEDQQRELLLVLSGGDQAAVDAFLSLVPKIQHGHDQYDSMHVYDTRTTALWGLIAQMRYPVGREMLVRLDGLLGDRPIRLLGAVGDWATNPMFPEGTDGNGFLRLPSGQPNPGAAQIERLELVMDPTLSAHPIYVGIDGGRLAFYTTPPWVTLFHEEGHMIRFLQGIAADKKEDIGPEALIAYDEPEELANIRMHENALLGDMRYPMRLGHHGATVMSSTGLADVDLFVSMVMQPSPSDFRKSALKGQLEAGRIDLATYNANAAALGQKYTGTLGALPKAAAASQAGQSGSGVQNTSVPQNGSGIGSLLSSFSASFGGLFTSRHGSGSSSNNRK